VINLCEYIKFTVVERIFRFVAFGWVKVGLRFSGYEKIVQNHQGLLADSALYEV